MTELVVVDHHYDTGAEVYRLTIGTLVPVTTAELDENDEPIVENQLVPIEDFVFAAFDERWEGKTAEEAAREQKRLVRAALRKREEAVAAAPDVSLMPGVGDPL